MQNKIEIGDYFGRWTVIGEVVKPGEKYYICRCMCGTTREVRVTNLKSGTSVSCGCRRVEAFILANGIKRIGAPDGAIVGEWPVG